MSVRAGQQIKITPKEEARWFAQKLKREGFVAIGDSKDLPKRVVDLPVYYADGDEHFSYFCLPDGTVLVKLHRSIPAVYETLVSLGLPPSFVLKDASLDPGFKRKTG